MSISVVVPTRNSEKTIDGCLSSLCQQTYPAQQLIVVDGKSTDSTIERVRRFQNVKLIQNPPNDTAGIARNRGAEVATGDIIFFCDSDCIVERKALQYHATAHEKRKDVIGVMGSIRNATSGNPISDFVQKQVLMSEWSENLDVDGTIRRYFCSANFTMLRRGFLERRFREDLVSSEDADLFIRLSQEGSRILFEPRAFVYHHHPTTLEQLFRRFFWYGESLPQMQRIHGDVFTERDREFSRMRYLFFSKKYLQAAVLTDNRLLCEGCMSGTLQHCGVHCSQLAGSITQSEVDLHRLTCLATAAGILKQRAGIDCEATIGGTLTDK